MDVPSSLFPSSIPLPPNTVLQQWPRCIGRKKARQTARPSQEKPPRCRTEPPRRAVCAVLSCALPSERQQKQALKNRSTYLFFFFFETILKERITAQLSRKQPNVFKNSLAVFSLKHFSGQMELIFSIKVLYWSPNFVG